MISIKNVTKIYKNKKTNVVALDDISFDLPNKGFVGLSGENGSGKTTLLNVISSVDTNFIGEVIIDDCDVKKDCFYLRQNVVSYVLQEAFIVDNISIKDNVLLSNPNYNNELLNEFNLSTDIDKNIMELSGGQKQKISLLRDSMKNCEILLVDEPTNNLDDISTEYVYKYLNELSKTKLVVLVCHDMDKMNSYCDLIIKLSDGHIETIINNNTADDVLYDEIGVLFLGNVNLHAIDKNKMNAIVDKHNEFKIKIKDDELNKEFDYSINPHIKKLSKMTSIQEKIINKSYRKKNLSVSVLFCLILSILFLITSIFYDFRFFDSEKFLFDTLSKNQNSYLICKPTVSHRMDDKITKEKLIDYSLKNDISIDLCELMENTIRYQFEEKELYKSSLNSKVFSDFNNFEFIVGDKPLDLSTIVITDYIADALILGNQDYNKYEDIIEKGIYLGLQKILVSGIINTDYERYNKDNLTEKEKIDFKYYLDTIYASMFYSNTSDTKSITGVHLKSIDLFSNLEFDETLKDNQCIINSYLASKFGYNSKNEYIKTEYGYLKVIKVENIDSNQNYIKVSNDFKENIFSNNSSFDYFMVNIENENVYDFINQHSIKYCCYSYEYASDAIDVIDTLKNLFLNMLILLIFVVILCVSRYLLITSNKNKNLYFIVAKNGLLYRDYIKIELKNLFLFLVISTLVNILIYFLMYNAINLILSKTFEINVRLFNFKILTSIVINFEFVFVSIMAYFVKIIKRKKISLIDYLN